MLNYQARDMAQQIIQESLTNLIGLPYAAYDCYELVKFFYLKIFDYELQDYQYINPNDKKEISYLIDIKKQSYKKITRPEFGDIILLRLDGLPAHLGIYIDKARFLHTTEKTGSCIDNLKTWKHKIIGYYRPWLKLE